MSTIDRAALIEQAAKAIYDLHESMADAVDGTTDWADLPEPWREEWREASEAAVPVIAKALLAPLRKLHAEKLAVYPTDVPEEDRTFRFCRGCSADYPCPTVRLLDAIEAEVSA